MRDRLAALPKAADETCLDILGSLITANLRVVGGSVGRIESGSAVDGFSNISAAQSARNDELVVTGLASCSTSRLVRRFVSQQETWHFLRHWTRR